MSKTSAYALDSVFNPFASAAIHLAGLEGEKDKATNRFSELEDEHMNLKASDSSSKGQVSQLRVNKKLVCEEVVFVGVHCDKLSAQLISRRTELERSRVALAVGTDFVDVLKSRIAAMETSLVRERKKLEVRLGETSSRSGATSSGMTIATG